MNSEDFESTTSSLVSENDRVGYWAHGERLVDRLFDRVDRLSPIRFLFSLILPLTLVFAATASWTLPQDPDVITIAVSGWHLGNTGSPFLPGFEHLTEDRYFGPMGSFRMAPQGPVSQYPPGASLLAAPLYAVTPGDLEERSFRNPSKPELGSVDIALPSFWQATLVAVLSTATAIALLGLLFRGQGGGREAWLAAWVAGLGTSAWSVASGQLFMHGPTMLWISLAMILSSRRSYFWSGLAFGAAVLTRPHTAVIAACVGIALGIRDRSLRPILRIGLSSGVGLVGLLAYNHHVFGAVSVSGGYSEVFTHRLTAIDPLFLFKNLAGGLFDPAQGFLVWTPFLAMLAFGLSHAWRKSEPLIRGAAIGGLIYLLLQYTMNRYNPGNTTLYRYPLEALTASAPLWFAAYQHWVKGSSARRRRVFRKLVLTALVLHLIGALFM